MKVENSAFLRLSSSYTFHFIYLGIFSPFWAMWLTSRGLDPSEIGVIISVPYFMKIFVAPIISQAADRREEYWRPLIICMIFTVLFSSLYFFANGFWAFFLIAVAVNFFLPAVMPLLETITVSQTNQYNLNYGKIRSFGSVSFIIATVCLGIFLKYNSIDAVLWASFLSLVCVLIAAFFLPRGNKNLSLRRAKSEVTGNPLITLMKNKNFIWFLCAVGFLQMSHGVFYSMGSVYWNDRGINEDVIGYLWAIGIVAEIGVFLFAGNYINRTPIRNIFLTVGILGVLRWAVMGYSLSLPVLFIIQLLHGLTFGMSHLAAIKYLGKNITPSLSGSAQSLYTAFPLGLGMGLSTYVGSLLYENFNGGAYYAMSLLCAFTVIISIPYFHRKK